MRIRDNNKLVILSHYPMEEWDGLYRGSYHLFGHVHNKDQHLLKLDNRFNVCTDVIGFTPRILDELIEIRESDKLNFDLYKKIVEGLEGKLSKEILEKIAYTSIPNEGKYDDHIVIRVHLSDDVDMDEMGCILISIRKSAEALGYSNAKRIMVDFLNA
ncbi:hypothetical protein [Romboutsia sp.]|uniref:hypothetical protein n=1 Tax=Romboutsia sp. TaxID=1965302 RepID=UPI003F3A374B